MESYLLKVIEAIYRCNSKVYIKPLLKYKLWDLFERRKNMEKEDYSIKKSIEMFYKLGLSYDDIDQYDIYELIKLLNKNIADYNQDTVFMIKEPIFEGKKKNVIFNNSGRLKFAEIRCLGAYFDDRQAITFDEDGTITLAGWADLKNMRIFTSAFRLWCIYLFCNKDVNHD